MALRWNGIIQVWAGVFLVIVGTIGAGSSFLLGNMNVRMNTTVRHAAEQCSAASAACRDLLPLLDDADRTSTAARTSLGSLHKSLDELAKREDEWRKNGDNINESIGGFGSRVKELGNAIDIKIPKGVGLKWDSSKTIPFPNGVEIDWWDGLQKVAKPMQENGDKLSTMGAEVKKTVNTVVDEFERNRGPMITALDEASAGLADTGAAARSLKTKAVPDLSAHLATTSVALVDVADHLPMAGWFLEAVGLAGLIGGIICVLNGLAILDIDRRLKHASRTNSTLAGDPV